MSLTLTSHIEARINAKIETGKYGSVEEVMEYALSILDEHERLEELRAQLQIGIDQLDRGDRIPWTLELLNDIDREVDERIRRGEQPNIDVLA